MIVYKDKRFMQIGLFPDTDWVGDADWVLDDNDINEVSGGQLQRACICRSLINQPKMIFADEPTGALDTETGLRVMKLFRDLIEKEGVTIVMTTHDPNLMELGDVVYELEDGEIIDRQIRG